MSISDDDFERMLSAHFETTTPLAGGDAFVEVSLRNINRLVRARLIIRASFFAFAALISLLVVPWQGIWAVMAETPVDMTMLMVATPIALLVQFWAYLRFHS